MFCKVGRLRVAQVDMENRQEVTYLISNVVYRTLVTASLTLRIILERSL